MEDDSHSEAECIGALALESFLSSPPEWIVVRLDDTNLYLERRFDFESTEDVLVEYPI